MCEFFIAFHSTYLFYLLKFSLMCRLPLSGEPKRETFKHVLQEAISVQNKELQSCTRALINGKLVLQDLKY